MRKKFLIPALICLLLCLLCTFLYFRPRTAPAPAPAQTATPKTPQKPEQPTPQREEPTAATDPEQERTEPAAPEEPATPYVSPVDFASLQVGNPDIYAWLSIEGSEVSYPVVQNADDTYYLTHDVDFQPSDAGAIFTESAYNSKAFDDPITAIYGHRMYSGEMFGALQPMYSSLSALEEYSEIIIYLPDGELHYEVFAAVPYDNRHIPYNYNDGTAWSIAAFLQSISSVKSLDAYVSEDCFANSGDRLLVLSTCLYGNRNRRFLVVAKLVSSIY